MPMPSIGIIVLLCFCGAGVCFMLWALYHFVLESTERPVYTRSDWPAKPEGEKVGSEKRPVLIS
jgi:hypothetical protein